MPPALPPVPRRRRYGTVLGSLVVLLFVFGYLGFWLILDQSIDGGEEVKPGTTIAVSDRISYVPADGWSLEKEQVTPGQQSTVTRQAGVFRIAVSSWQGTFDQEVARTKKLLEVGGKAHFYSDDQSFHNGSGLSGVKFSYYTTSVEGIVWISYDEKAQKVVTITASTPTGELQRQLGQFERMVDSVNVKTEAAA